MIDNDVFGGPGMSKDYEFYQASAEEAHAISQYGEEDWKIKWDKSLIWEPRIKIECEGTLLRNDKSRL